jgi:hypothetical protein
MKRQTEKLEESINVSVRVADTTYSRKYWHIRGGMIKVDAGVHGQKSAEIGSLQPKVLAEILLRELVRK